MLPGNVLAKALGYIKFLFVFLSFVLLGNNLKAQDFSKFEADTVSPAGTKYLLYLPPSYDPSPQFNGTFPLLVVLHGGASIGDDLSLILTQQVHFPPARLIMDGNWLASRPFLVLSPQLKRDLSVPNPNNQEWPMEVIDEVVEYVKSQYLGINPNQVYFTGISLGGAAVWNYAANFPEKVAAINPISGKTDTLTACNVKDIPIWAFHGAQDGLVPTHLSIEMVNAINNCTPVGAYKPKLNLMNTLAHEGWNGVWDYSFGDYIYDWMLQFEKNNTSNAPPYVNIGKDRTVHSRTGEFYLQGDYFDWDGTISSATWSQTSGPTVSMSGIDSKFLKIQSLPAGNYDFTLTVIDNDNAISSRTIHMEVLDSAAPNDSEITGMKIYDAVNDTLLGSLEESQIINLNLLGVNELNIEAIGNANTQSVKFSVNSDYHVRYTFPGPFFLLDQKSAIGREWLPGTGEYLVCATPYKIRREPVGPPGVTQCYKLSVYDQPILNYYSKPGTDLSLLSSWEDTPGGSSPDSFSGDFVNFYVNNSAHIDGALDINGVESRLIIESAGQLDIHDSFNGSIVANYNSIVNIYTDQPVNIESAHAGSHFNFLGSDAEIGPAIYGNVSLLGGGTKTFSGELTQIKGDFFVSDNCQIQGNTGNSSSVEVEGNITFEGTQNLAIDDRKISLNFTGGGLQTITGDTDLSFYELVVSNSSAVKTNMQAGNIFTLGTSLGGGITVSSGSTLDLSGLTLKVSGSGTINSGNETGEIGLENSIVDFISTASVNSNLYPMAGKNAVVSIDYDAPSTTSLVIQGGLDVKNYVNVTQGIVNSNGHMRLLSTSDTTSAYVKSLSSGAQITGDVSVQRYMEGEGKLWRHIASPVAGATVDQLQESIPVTGIFAGASTGYTDNPSMYSYDESQVGNEWINFPPDDGDSTEVLVSGRGYVVWIRE
ncbi:MAG: hypothetical protein KDC79_17020, partial [Cyclobacteriaceae bacterium]|nr:hypothetical protein [Cyclobacteriaceae bacterium]